jgi:hypothetical protein
LSSDCQVTEVGRPPVVTRLPARQRVDLAVVLAFSCWLVPFCPEHNCKINEAMSDSRASWTAPPDDTETVTPQHIART